VVEWLSSERENRREEDSLAERKFKKKRRRQEMISRVAQEGMVLGCTGTGRRESKNREERVKTREVEVIV